MSKRLLLSIDNHFIRTPDGKVWNNGIVGPMFWEKYLQYFTEVRVLCRMAEGSYEDVEDLKEVSYPGVTFLPVPMFQGIRSLLRANRAIRKRIEEAIAPNDYDLLVVRIPSILGFYLLQHISTLRCKMAVEVVSDMSTRSSGETFASALKNKLLHLLTKRAVAEADGVSYVTRYALEKVYPPKEGAVRAYYSSIDLPESYYATRVIAQPETFRLLHVSTLNDEAKGYKTLFTIASRLREAGLSLEVIVVGDGKLRTYYEHYVREQGLADLVRFTGNISDKQALRQIYQEADLLVFPTEHEGLPRVLIEAMATGLPILSTDVGGIPELLSAEEVFSYKDIDGMTKRALELLADPALRQVISDQGYQKAREYRYEVLQEKRYQFFQALTWEGQV